jgi:Fe-S cluster biogenesis protein NfuA
VLKIRLIGACGTCPQSYMTFKTGIETSIMQAVPEITKIIPLNFFPEDDL